MENKIEIRGEVKKDGITYLSLQQLVKDFKDGRGNQTEDISHEVVEQKKLPTNAKH